MTTAFVAGATGYTGAALVRTLVGAGLNTIAHVRPDSPKLNFWHTQFRDAGAIMDTTAWTEAAMTHSLAQHQPQLIFAMLGTTARRMRAAREQGLDVSYEAIDYCLTHVLFQASTRCESQPRFVYLSSMGVSARSRSPYMRARWKMEQELLDGELPCTIARPSFISGADRPESRPLERTGAAATDLALNLAGLVGFQATKNRYRSTDATQLAIALLRHATHPISHHQVVEADALRV